MDMMRNRADSALSAADSGVTVTPAYSVGTGMSNMGKGCAMLTDETFILTADEDEAEAQDHEMVLRKVRIVGGVAGEVRQVMAKQKQ
ncbi:hypothetical protein D5S17_16710 [Pseudonocardiaceae bacterium YIM PH 21723]|nr:hypothetical protein D5S17_16710 [Pseudonocardiaceae bacterium YIM PH 21723]